MFALRESLANWASRPLLNATLAGLVAALLIAVAYIEIAAAEDAQSASDELVSDGYTTLLVGRNEQLQPKLRATDCAALDTTAGIVAATWSAEGSPTQLWSPNGPKLPTTVAGPGMLNLLAASPSALGAWTGEQLFIDATSDIASNSALTAVAFEPNTDGVPIALLPTNLAILGQGATAGLV